MEKEAKKEEKMYKGKVERLYNQKTMVVTVATVGVVAYKLGKNNGARKNYLAGLKDGIAQGLAEGRLEGYVSAMNDVASVVRRVTE